MAAPLPESALISNVKEADGMAPAEKVEEIRMENAATEINVIDLERLAAESIQFKSRATFRLVIVILIQAISECFRQMGFLRFH